MSRHLTTGAIGFAVGVASAMGVSAAIAGGVLPVGFALTPRLLALEGVFFVGIAAILAVFWNADASDMEATA